MHDVSILKNDLLGALPANIYQHLIPKLEQVDLEFGTTVYSPGDTLSHVYFVEQGIISMLIADDEHSTIEVGMVGHEGMVALPVFLGVSVSKNKAVVQGDGHALRMKAANFVEACATHAELSRIMRLFTYSIMMQIARSAICNRFHSTESRLARWLLMTQDRMRSDKFRITQEFLSYMVGVRREAVNKAAGGFQRSGLISYTRGNMTVNNREGLRALACNCYEMTQHL